MGTLLRYAIAKYVPDLFRQEPRNIGVFVVGSTGAAARLLGENELGVLQLNKITRGLFNDASLYRSWHRYWRGLVRRANESIPADQKVGFLMDELSADRGAYSVWDGGEIHLESEIDLQEIADDLFGRLVATDEDAPADDEADVPSPPRSGRLATEIRRVFRGLQILESGRPGRRRNRELLVDHPIVERAPVDGTLDVPHRPTFLQENGRKYVMEHVDFTVQPSQARQHAAYAAFMLGDIHEAANRRGVLDAFDLIAIVNRARQGNVAAQIYGLAALSAQPRIRIVHWDDPEEKEDFLAERVEIAGKKY